MLANWDINSGHRQWPEIRQSLYATHIFGVISFYQLGTITYRNSVRWDHQNILLPLVFCFFPLLYPCQVIVASLLALRNYTWRPSQGIKYYACAILCMHAVRTSFRDADDNIDDTAERKGPGLLLDVFRPRARPLTRPWNEARVFNLVVALLSLYQATSVSILYLRRCVLHPSAVLEVDHRTGLMALGAMSSSLGYIFFEATGYAWQDTLCAPAGPNGVPAGPKLPDYPTGTLHAFQGHVSLIESLDVTNKHVYDCQLAVCVHLFHLRRSGRFFPLFERRTLGSVGVAMETVIPSLLALFVGFQLIAQSFLSLRTRVSYSRVPGGSKLVRVFILLVMLYISVVTVTSEVKEVRQVVGRNATSSLNEDWAWRDGWSDFLWPL